MSLEHLSKGSTPEYGFKISETALSGQICPLTGHPFRHFDNTGQSKEAAQPCPSRSASCGCTTLQVMRCSGLTQGVLSIRFPHNAGL